MTEFVLNDKIIRTEKPSGSLLLDFVRYDKTLTGTKIGCREGDCGACTVLIGEIANGQMKYKQVTSCLTPIGNVQGKHVVTVEGLNMDHLSPVQQSLVDEQGTQCGFCTVGFVVSLTGLCLLNSKPTYKDAITAIDGNICRCTGYKSIERAAGHITKSLANKNAHETVNWLVEEKFIPHYFNQIPTMLKELSPQRQVQESKVLVGGGTDLYVQNHLELVDKEIGLMSRSTELRFIDVQQDICTIGGGTTVTDLLESRELNSLFPKLSEHIKLVSSTPIRNISTIAGNFVNASPIGDFTAFFLALNTEITLTEKEQNRIIFLKDFYKAYKDLDKSAEEVITKISFNTPSKMSVFNLEKVSKRIHLDIASVNTAVLITTLDNSITDVHLSAGGVGPIPTYLKNTCGYLQGKELNVKTIKGANEVLQSEIAPISDVRGTADYKRLLMRQLFYAHFIKLFPTQISLEGLK